MTDPVETAEVDAKDATKETVKETTRPSRSKRGVDSSKPAVASAEPEKAVEKSAASDSAIDASPALNASLPEAANADAAFELDGARPVPVPRIVTVQKPDPLPPLREEGATPSGLGFSRQRLLRARNLRYGAIAAGALVVGVAFGMIASPKERTGKSLSQIHAGLEAGRVESSRLNSEVERLTKQLAGLRESSEAARNENKSRGSNLSDRFAKLEQGVDKKLANLADKVEQSERKAAKEAKDAARESAREAAKAEVRPEPKPEPKSEAKAERPEPSRTGSISEPKAKPEPKSEAKAERSEPSQTGSIAEPKAKPETIDTWALREVYDGIALLEDRKRRLVEVAAGDSIPGIGRVESVERRGRSWVVVTGKGLITTQAW